MLILRKAVVAGAGLLVGYAAIALYNQFTFLHGVTKGDRIDSDKLRRRALLVIDVQTNYPKAGPDLERRDRRGHALLTNVNRAITEFLSAGHEVVFVVQVKEPGALRSLFMPHVPVEGSEAARVNPAVWVEGAPTFPKYRADAFSNPGLQAYLTEKGVGELWIVGLAAEVCVNFTVQGALARGYAVHVIPEALFALFGERSKGKRLRKFADWGAIIESIDVCCPTSAQAAQGVETGEASSAGEV